VLLVSLPGCPYCELVRRNYLLPARNESGLEAWQLNVNDNSTPLTGFDGKATTAAAWTKTWKASFTPTVLFLGPEGQKLAEPLVGVAVPDFYGAYLDERLALARTAFFALR
jgi:thioredoxin-related protein